jgi:hypothetical protein
LLWQCSTMYPNGDCCIGNISVEGGQGLSLVADDRIAHILGNLRTTCSKSIPGAIRGMRPPNCCLLKYTIVAQGMLEYRPNALPSRICAYDTNNTTGFCVIGILWWRRHLINHSFLACHCFCRLSKARVPSSDIKLGNRSAQHRTRLHVFQK